MWVRLSVTSPSKTANVHHLRAKAKIQSSLRSPGPSGHPSPHSLLLTSFPARFPTTRSLSCSWTALGMPLPQGLNFIVLLGTFSQRNTWLSPLSLLSNVTVLPPYLAWTPTSRLVLQITSSFPCITSSHVCACVCVGSVASVVSSSLDHSTPGTSVHAISQAGILEWFAIFSSRRSSQPRDWTQVSCIADGFFTAESPGKP